MNSLNACLKCLKADNWIYSYEASLTRLLEKALQVAHINHKLDLQSLFPQPVMVKLEQHSLLIEGNQIEVSQYGQLLNIRIIRFGKEQQIVLWNITRKEVLTLVLEIGKTLQHND